MKNYKILSEEELNAILADYISRCDILMSQISDYISGNTKDKETIQNTYKTLKSEVKEIYRYCDKVSNENDSNNFYTAYFVPSIMEASAYGFIKPTNSKVNQALYNSVEEAHYRLEKYIK